jgi:hypothetical protein
MYQLFYSNSRKPDKLRQPVLPAEVLRTCVTASGFEDARSEAMHVSGLFLHSQPDVFL